MKSSTSGPEVEASIVVASLFGGWWVRGGERTGRVAEERGEVLCDPCRLFTYNVERAFRFTVVPTSFISHTHTLRFALKSDSRME